MSGIQMMLLGTAGGATIVLTDVSIGQPISGSTAQSRYEIDGTDGKVYQQVNFDPRTEIEQWCTPSTAAGQYEVRATLSAGSTPTGNALNTWIDLDNNFAAWELQTNPINSDQSIILVEVRQKGTTSPVYDATVTLTTDAQ